MARADRDPDIRAVVFTGAHPERFVSHAAVRWLQEESAASPSVGLRGATAAVAQRSTWTAPLSSGPCCAGPTGNPPRNHPGWGRHSAAELALSAPTGPWPRSSRASRSRLRRLSLTGRSTGSFRSKRCSRAEGAHGQPGQEHLTALATCPAEGRQTMGPPGTVRSVGNSPTGESSSTTRTSSQGRFRSSNPEPDRMTSERASHSPY